MSESIASPSSSAVQPSCSERVLALGAGILASEAETLNQLAEQLDDRFTEVVEQIVRTSCKGNGRVILTGMGKAGLIGKKIAATFSSTGTPAFFLHPADALHGDLGAVRSGDLLLFLSHSGETEELLRLVNAVERFQLTRAAITHPDSHLARQVDILLPLVAQEHADPLTLAPSNSTTAMLALGDALAFCVARRCGFEPEDFARYHPGGSLGRKLSRAEEQMRPLSECRVASADQTVRAIFTQTRIPGRRSGAILLIDSEGRLAGIFTDSDLAKRFESRDDGILDRPIKEVMTSHPVAVHCQTKMEEVLALIAARKISELPVLDDDSRPVGLIDITDLV